MATEALGICSSSIRNGCGTGMLVQHTLIGGAGGVTDLGPRFLDRDIRYARACERGMLKRIREFLDISARD